MIILGNDIPVYTNCHSEHLYTNCHSEHQRRIFILKMLTLSNEKEVFRHGRPLLNTTIKRIYYFYNYNGLFLIFRCKGTAIPAFLQSLIVGILSVADDLSMKVLVYNREHRGAGRADHHLYRRTPPPTLGRNSPEVYLKIGKNELRPKSWTQHRIL